MGHDFLVKTHTALCFVISTFLKELWCSDHFKNLHIKASIYHSNVYIYINVYFFFLNSKLLLSKYLYLKNI